MKTKWGKRAGAYLTIGTAAGTVCLLRTLPARADVLGIGKAFGGIIDSAAAPVLGNLEGTSDRLIGNVDARVNKDIDHTGLVVKDILGGTIKGVDKMGRGWLDQADGILTTSITNVFAKGDASVAKAIGELGGLEKLLIKDETKVIGEVNGDLKDRLDQANQILESRIVQLNGVVTDAIAQADADVKDRIQQGDEAAQKALGSADVLAAKETLSVQQALLRVGALLGMVAFLVAAFRFFFDHLSEYLRGVQDLLKVDQSQQVDERRQRRRRFAALSAGSLVAHLAGAAIVAWIFLGLSHYLPMDAQKDKDELTNTHRKALDLSLAALDFTKVRYHAAELAILDPGREQEYRGLERRADLIRAVLTRPGLFGSDDGVQQLNVLVADAQLADTSPGGAALPDAGASSASPDVLAAEAYIRWRLAKTRTDESHSVSLFAQALEKNVTAKPSGDHFVLAQVATHYVTIFVERYVAWDVSVAPVYTRERLEQLAKSVVPTFVPLKAWDAYDNMVLKLDRASTAGYVAMLDAQADLDDAVDKLGKHGRQPNAGASNDGLSSEQIAVLNAKNTRLDAAKKVRDAWLAFDTEAVQESSFLPTAAGIATLALNDAPLSQALGVIERKDYVMGPDVIMAEPQLLTRLKMAPVRIAWGRRYLGPLSVTTQGIAAREVARRYHDDEANTVSFAKAYVTYRKALKGNPSQLGVARDAAATSAATLGLYTTGSLRVPFGADLLDAKTSAPSPSVDVRKAAHDLNDQASLKLL